MRLRITANVTADPRKIEDNAYSITFLFVVGGGWGGTKQGVLCREMCANGEMNKNADRRQKRMKTQIEHVHNRNNGENCAGPLFFREDLCLKGQNVAHEGQPNWAEDQCRENKFV